jgi:hypothetical protein
MSQNTLFGFLRNLGWFPAAHPQNVYRRIPSNLLIPPG